MKHTNWKALLALSVCLAALLCGVQGAAEAAANPAKASAAQQLKQMSTFLSNFTEQGFYDFDVKRSGDDEALHLGGDPSNPDLIRFGIQHNYINNFKSRIRNCPKKNCPYGSLVIEAKFVAESVKKYYDIHLKHRSVDQSDPPYHYDGKLYHFDGADGEAVYYAEVQEATREGGVVRMTGELYNAEDKNDRPYTFEAAAKPYKWKGKDTWAILSLKTEEHAPDLHELMAKTEGTWRLDGKKNAPSIVMDGAGSFEAYKADGELDASGTLEPSEEYEGVYIFLMRDKSGKDLQKGFFMDSDTELHFGNDDGEKYIKDKD